ncbi:hypothetical protein HOY82DRAFT_153194 [Tuber indicum]|nr:hypothetical protein HOY82DRAFT_153194 [Tuber indicum]
MAIFFVFLFCLFRLRDAWDSRGIYLKTTFSQESRGEGEGKPPFVYNVTFFRCRMGSELVKGKRDGIVLDILNLHCLAFSAKHYPLSIIGPFFNWSRCTSPARPHIARNDVSDPRAPRGRKSKIRAPRMTPAYQDLLV